MNPIKQVVFGLAMSALAFAASPAGAVEVGGRNLPDTATVAGKELKLNGYGIRTRLTFKIYAIGMYFTDQRTTPAEALGDAGPRRFAIVMMRDLTGDEFGSAFMKVFRENTDKAELSKLVGQVQQFGEMFESVPALKAGDAMVIDWIPGTGSVVKLNDKPMFKEALPDVAFYNALLRIWLGEKPVETDQRQQLLNKGKTK